MNKQEFIFDQINPLAIASVLEDYYQHGWQILTLDLVKNGGEYTYYVILTRGSEKG